jgi:short-subunit dehydrogenase
MSKRSLREAVVVVTGASSGIGRATALAFARRGARVVVAARRREPLDSLIAECERVSGMSAVAVPTDVSDETQVNALAQRAIQRFGRIDVWMIEVDFFGYVYGARAALPHLKRQHGVLINNASVDSMASFPYFSAYVASKWAVRGFSASLRQELVSDGVDVCTILPASIDTPLFQHAANYMGRAMKALNPTYDPEQVAAAMLHCAENGGPREVIVGLAGRLLALQYTLAPGLSERIFRKQVELDHFSPSAPAVASDGNVLAPMADGVGTTGGWKDSRGHRLPRGVIAGAAVAALPMAGLLVRRWRTLQRHTSAPGVLAPMVGRIRSFG